jgi:cytochrome c oxidase assembly factor CtaG
VTAIGNATVYIGPPPLTPLRILTSWRPDLPTLLVVLALGASYLLAVRRLRARGRSWPRRHVLLFLGVGLGGIALASMSFLGVYADTLFWVRACTVILLLMLAPYGLAMGMPVTLADSVLSGRGQVRLRRALQSRPARVLTSPPVTSVVMIGTPWLLYFTAYYPAALRSSTVDELLRVHLVLAGFLYVYARMQRDLVPRHYPHLVSYGISIAESIFDAVLGLVLWLDSGHLVASGYYHALARPWGPSLRTDQVIGAGIIWIGGDLAGLPFLGGLLTQMGRDDDTEAALVDAALDAAPDTTSPQAPDGGTPSDGDQPPGRPRLWWEDDPMLAERFGRRR